MTVELLWWEGCPSHPEAFAELQRILHEEGVEAEVARVEIEDDEQARRERFPGSPTIRIDGEDIVPPGEAVLRAHLPRLPDARRRPSRRCPIEDLREAMQEQGPVSLGIGDPAPDFTLPDTAGEEHSLEGPAVVVFTCNHCPYALAWHDRIADAARDYPNVRFFAINPNDAERYPRDSLEAMRERVEREDWPMPYLHDESQEVARAFGAKTTRTCSFSTPSQLRYRGAPTRPPEPEPERELAAREALDSVLAARTSRPETNPIGCSSSGGDDRADRRLGVAQVLKQRVGLRGLERVEVREAGGHGHRPRPASRAASTSSGVSPTSTAPVGSP